MKNNLTTLLITALIVCSCAKKEQIEVDSIDAEVEKHAKLETDDLKDLELEIEESEPEVLKVEKPELYLKYYLKSKFSLYNSNDLKVIAENNYQLAKQDPTNLQAQEQAFLLLLAAQDYANALNIINNKQTDYLITFERLFNYSQQIAKGDIKTAEKTLGQLMNSQNRLPHLKILKAYFQYNKDNDIEKLKADILDINSSLALDGFKYYYIARAYEAKKEYATAFALYNKAFTEHTLRTEDVFSRLVYTAKKVEQDGKDNFKSNGKYGEDIYLVDQAFIDISKLKEVDNSLKAVSAQVLYDLGWSINQTTSNLAGLDFLALSDYIVPADKVKFQMAKGMYANDWTVTTTRLLESIEENSDYYLSARIVLADALKSTDSKKAIQVIKDLKANSKFNQHYLDSVLGQIYLESEQYKEAINALTSALENDKSSKVYFSRAVAYERAGMIPQSLADLNVALEKNPNNPIVLNYIGYLLVDIKGKADEGIDYIKRSIELDPTNPASLDSLGWAYLKLGKYKQALEYLEKAYGLETQDGIITGHLADAYYHNDRKEEAIIYWNKALELEKKDAREIQRIRNQLYKYNK